MQIQDHMLWPVTRHKELIAEARQIHVAARAVREARKVERQGPESQGPVVTSVAKRGAPPHQLRALGSPPSRRTAWRSAAWRMGHSLVAVGRRLERLGDA